MDDVLYGLKDDLNPFSNLNLLKSRIRMQKTFEKKGKRHMDTKDTETRALEKLGL